MVPSGCKSPRLVRVEGLFLYPQPLWTPYNQTQEQQWVEEEELGIVNDGNWVFTTTTARDVEPRALTRQFDRLVNKAGVKRIVFHDLRHTHATLMRAAGIHPKVAAERLGHSRVSLTMDRYNHLLPTLQEGAAVAVEEVLKDE